MEREQIERHLTEVAASIDDGATRIVQQQALVAALERDSHDTAEANRLLDDLQQQQIMHFADRDRLLMALAKAATEDTIARTGTAGENTRSENRRDEQATSQAAARKHLAG